jgi:hypothetical protein
MTPHGRSRPCPTPKATRPTAAASPKLNPAASPVARVPLPHVHTRPSAAPNAKATRACLSPRSTTQKTSPNWSREWSLLRINAPSSHLQTLCLATWPRTRKQTTKATRQPAYPQTQPLHPAAVRSQSENSNAVVHLGGPPVVQQQLQRTLDSAETRATAGTGVPARRIRSHESLPCCRKPTSLFFF